MKKKAVWGGCLAAVVLVVVVIIIIAAQPKKIHVEDYVQISYDGYSGYATARVSLDKEGLYAAILEAKGKSADSGSGSYLGMLFAENSQERAIYECIDVIDLSPSQTENLSNGDTITVQITYDNAAVKGQKIKFTGNSVSVLVEGLEEAVQIDPFEGLEVTFSGISPNGRLEYVYNGTDVISRYSFSVDRSSGLKNGDTVTITYSYYEDSMLSQGYVITRQEATYEVSGLDEYIMSYADLTGEFLEETKSQAEDVIYAYTAGSYNGGSALSDLEYAGYIFSAVKDIENNYGNVNYLYLIYSGMVSNSEGKFSTAKVYFPVKFCDIVKTESGMDYSSQSGINGFSTFSGSWYSTKGYINPLIGYTELVETARDRYVSECGDGFEEYAEITHVMQLSDISDAHKQELYADAEDIVSSYIAKYSQGINAEEPVLVGEYLLTAKSQGTDFARNNTYIIVYSSVISHERGQFEPVTVYFPVMYKGFVNLPGDAYLVTEEDGIQGFSGIPGSYWSTKGYVEGTEMYNKLITANRDLYSYEVSEGLKAFGE